VKDEFHERVARRFAPLGALAALGETVGVGIFLVGVLVAL